MYRSSSLAALASLCVCVSAQAQTATPPPDEIIVTGRELPTFKPGSATKSDLPLMLAPQSISVISSETIDALNLRTTAEALNYAAGVRSQSFGSETRLDRFQIRGFRNSSQFKDGLLLYRAGAFLDWSTPAEGIGRIDVLRGPSSSLYGGGNAGGLVNIVSRRPVEAARTTLEVGADEYGSVYGSVDSNSTLGDAVAVRAVGLIRRGDTQVELAEDNRTYGMVTLATAVDDRVNLLLRGSYTGDRSNRPTGFVPYEGFVTKLPDGSQIPIDLYVSDPSADRFDRDQYELGGEARVDLGHDVEFVSNARYGKIDLIYSGLYGSFSGNPDFVNGRFVLNRGNSYLDASLENITVDNRLAWSAKTGRVSHDLMVGLDYSASDVQNEQQSASAPALDIFDPVYDIALPAFSRTVKSGQDLDRVGLYLQDEASVGRVIIVGSARHDWIDAETLSRGTTQVVNESETTYRIGVSYRTNFGLVPYVNHASSFLPVLGSSQATGEAFTPETGDAWEAGVKYEHPQGKASLTVGLFSINREGVVVSDPQPGLPRNQSQSGRQRSQGIDVDARLRPTDELTLSAALSAFDVQTREGPAIEIGKTPVAAPETLAALRADYTFADSSSLAGWEAGLGLRYTGRSYADTANLLEVPDATVLDARLAYQFGGWTVAANVSNLFDKEYVSACASAGTCYAANLRRATFSLTKTFGETK